MSGDLPPPPPGFEIGNKPKPRKRKKGLFGSEKGGQPVEGAAVTGVVDGDTYRAQGIPNVRLLGVDAPELKQQGFDRAGNPVPVGEYSRDYAARMLQEFGGSVGLPDHYSYGRPVAPLSFGEDDAGLNLIREGQAFAAPQYISDESQRFDYLAAETRARQNRLGAHGVYTEDPATFRAPGYKPPETETIARFWDTPTPFAGQKPDVLKRFTLMAQDPNVPISEVTEYMRQQGSVVDPVSIRRARDYYQETGKWVGYVQADAPKQMIDEGHSQAEAGALAFGDGALMSGLAEAGAIADTLGGTDGRESVWNSDRRLADIWQNNYNQNEAILRFNADKHPVTTTGASIAGGVTTGFAIPYAAGASVPRMAAYGGAWGAGEGFLGTDGTVPERLTGAAQMAPIGAIADPALAKAIDAAAPVVRKGWQRLRGRGDDIGSAGRAADSGAGEAVENEAADAFDAPDEGVPPPPAGFEVQGATPAAPMLADAMPALTAGPDAIAKARRLLDPTSKAELLATAARVNPSDVLPIPSNRVGGVDEAAGIEAGRYVDALPYDESKALTRGTVRNYRGEDIPKVGPLDLVGYVRTLGGLRDDAGELAHMGITGNAPRRGMDFVGQEARFGPLVDPEGMSFDDAALSAWEAGYFPQTERPDVNTFLDALGETYNGGAGRRFRTDDLGEVEAFEGLRAERIDLEEQRALNGNVVNDMSGPADAAPFPPVQAYEEWPSEAIERVNNIDVGRLDTPQDISRALKATDAQLGGFDAAKRGRITQAETERLASELNMTPEQLLSRRSGQAFNAEEALAARQILAKSGNELVNIARRVKAMDDPGEEVLADFRKKWMRHAAIQEQVTGMTAEAGRALSQFRKAADARAVRSDVLGALVRAGGGKGNLKDAADALIDAVEMGPGKFNALAAKAAKPKWKDKVGELYINFLLSNPPTHIVNAVSNTGTALLQIPEYATGAVIGALRNAVTRGNAADRIMASEVGARTFGLVQGTKEGARLFAKALRTGEADDFVTKVEGDEFKAISGLKGEVIRTPTRMLTAADQLFKGVARRMELNALATRQAAREGLRGEEAAQRIAELVSNPPDDMLQKAMEYGRYLTFQNQLGEFGQGLSRMTNENLLGKFVVPFVRTPINLMKFATERSLAAPLLKEWRADFRAGGSRRDMAVARMMLGTGFAATMYQAALDGQITGGRPPDSAKARLLYADGWQPYSVRVGDKWVSYSRLDPLSTTIGVAADMATLPENLSERQSDDKATMLVASIMGNLASKTWLSGMSDFVSALDDPGRNAGNWMERLTSSLAVPAGVAGVARQIDPVARKRESVGEAIQARIPGMTDSLYPRRDVFGEAIKLDSLGPDFLSPFWQSQQKNDPVVAEMLRIGKSVSAPGKQYTQDGERLDYTPAEYDRYHEIAGRLSYNSLLGLIGSAEYERMSDDGKRKAAKKAMAEARKTARGVIDDLEYALPERGAAYVPAARGGEGDNAPGAPSIPPPPAGFSIPPPPPGFKVQ